MFGCDGKMLNCQKVYSEVLNVQKELNLTFNYIYITADFENEFFDFYSKLDMEYVFEEEVGTFSEFFGSKGVVYFPAIIVIKDGKQVDGMIGINLNYNDLLSMIKKYI